MSEKKPVRNGEIIWRRFEENVLIFDPETGDLSRLNITAARIWELMDGKHTTGEIAEAICSEFEDATVDRVKEGLTRILEDFETRGIMGWG